jgi:hypothetical protein
MALRSLARTIGLGVVVMAAACARPAIDARPRAQLATPPAGLGELWNEPKDLEKRNLLWGSSPRSAAPSTTIEYKVVGIDNTGYSDGYDVVGPDGRVWDIKLGKESQPEVSVSRILWALGYHQPVVYYLTDWKLAGDWKDEGVPARFRLESDHEDGGDWQWGDNPFASSRPLRGLIAVNLLLANWDLKTSNNRVYRMRGTNGARRFVVQDLGASLGKFRAFPTLTGTRNEVDDFEGTALVKEVNGSKVLLDFHGRRTGVIEQMEVADVVWACELLNRLSDAQLDDAFEAAGYEPSVRKRFVTKVRAKIREGLDLRSKATGSAQ